MDDDIQMGRPWQGPDAMVRREVMARFLAYGQTRSPGHSLADMARAEKALLDYVIANDLEGVYLTLPKRAGGFAVVDDRIVVLAFTVTLTEEDVLPAAPASRGLPSEYFAPLGTRCPVCKCLQYDTPSGPCCDNGHGG